VRERELRRFAELRPLGMRLLERATASMPNGVPMTWMTTIYDHPPIVVSRGNGATFTDVDGGEPGRLGGDRPRGPRVRH
jgi:glutamate-1-semialdehyde 2,1-aminomutase